MRARDSKKSTTPQLRLRVFAGPNGSGKSTIINGVSEKKVQERPIDLGYYINADEIARDLKEEGFSFSKFRIRPTAKELLTFAEASGLLFGNFTPERFKKSFALRKQTLIVVNNKEIDRIGQVIARFLRAEMLRLKRRFSFETVFSHPSNLDIMREAATAGYKVYLYYVSTASPEINKFRVELRVREGGHDVPEEKIKSRYFNSLELLYDAAQIAYQAFFFDNTDKTDLIAHFKRQGETAVWDEIDLKKIPDWFKKYYLDKEH